MGKNWLTITKENDVGETTLANHVGGLYVYHYEAIDSSNPEHVAMIAESPEQNEMLPQASAKLDEAVLMHARLGHPGIRAFNQLADKLNYPRLNKDRYTLCPTCSLSKAAISKGKPPILSILLRYDLSREIYVNTLGMKTLHLTSFS